MNDEALHRRILDAVLAPPDPERDRALERELADRPELLREYRRLREVWGTLGELPVHEEPEGARSRAEEAARTAIGAEGVREVAGRRSRALTAAAIALAFLGGAGAGVWWSSPEPQEVPTSAAAATVDDGARYVLLIRGGDSPDGEEAATAAMTDWARELFSRDRLLWAERLTAERGLRVGAEPGAGGGGPAVGGLFVIRAADREEAARIARDAPHLAWGGVVDVLPTAAAARR